MFKPILFLIFVSFAVLNLNAQESITLNGETLELKTEIDGRLDLLWNIIDGKYRYFVRTEDGQILELTNTKNADKKYKEEYKSILDELTNNSQSTKRLKLTLYSLRNFIDEYNSSVDTNYNSSSTEPDVKFRLGLSGGITNVPFVLNPNNEKTPLAMLELEIFEANVLSKHSGFLQARHVFESDKLLYSTTELSLGYRYRIINLETFNIYGQVKFATLNFTSAEIPAPQGATTVSSSSSSFDVPFIFGIGADIAVGGGFITINYGELFAVFFDNQGNFSTDITLGYKFNI